MTVVTHSAESRVCNQTHLCVDDDEDDDDRMERAVRESFDRLPGETYGPALGYSDQPPIPNLGPAEFLIECHEVCAL